jgi:hypothetical protein
MWAWFRKLRILVNVWLKTLNIPLNFPQIPQKRNGVGTLCPHSVSRSATADLGRESALKA